MRCREYKLKTFLPCKSPDLVSIATTKRQSRSICALLRSLPHCADKRESTLRSKQRQLVGWSQCYEPAPK